MVVSVAARGLLWCAVANRRCDVDDTVNGQMEKAEGKVKEEFGKVAQLKGEVQTKGGDVERQGRREDGIDEPAR